MIWLKLISSTEPMIRCIAIAFIVLMAIVLLTNAVRVLIKHLKTGEVGVQ
mgnify:CR=1 FL=1